MYESFVRAEIVYFLTGIIHYHQDPVLSDWHNLSAIGASPQGHKAQETTRNSGKWEWESLSALQVSTAVKVHTLIAVTGTSAPLRGEPCSIWPWHSDLTGCYMQWISLFGHLLKSPIFIAQKAAASKNGVEFYPGVHWCHQMQSSYVIQQRATSPKSLLQTSLTKKEFVCD